ncbi:MAG: ribonuclease P protein component [Muribaculaceae bacterium]|nr:ribonuclease P protein component [Muribaculaceae bacterium]
MEATTSYRFPKSQRLHHRSLVDGVFRKGKSFYEFPLRVNWRILSPEELESNFRSHVPESIGKMQMMVTVPKKKRRRAVDRVLLRRRIREAYRLNYGFLRDIVEADETIATLSISFVYIHNDNLDYPLIETKMKSALVKLLSKVAPSNP